MRFENNVSFDNGIKLNMGYNFDAAQYYNSTAATPG